MTNYTKALKRALDGASAGAFSDRSAAQLNEIIADISRQLLGPLSDAERILLVADRKAARDALTAVRAS